jgi:hypothetical protein
VKKLLQVGRAGRDIGKVLQRYIFPLTTLDEKLQYSSLIAEPYYLSLQNDRICKTLKIFLPDLQSRFLHTFPPARGGEIEREPLSPKGERVG